MKIKVCPYLLLLIILFLGRQTAFGQTEKSTPYGEGKFLRYTIKNWYKGKEAAVTLTFDDAYRSQFRLAVPLLTIYSFKATFFIVTNRIGKGYSPDWDSVRYLANMGHEIGSHTMNHADFDTLINNPKYLDSLKKELYLSMRTINRYIPLQKCRSFAWPYGKVNQASIEFCRKYYLQARSSFNNYEVIDPVNMLCLSSQKIYNGTTLVSMNKMADDILRINGWLIERYHGFRTGSDTNGYEPIDIEIFRKHLDYIKIRENSLWVSTLDNVASYIRERNCTGLRILDNNEKGFKISVSNALPDSLNTVPVSIDVQLDGSLKYLAQIRQHGRVIPFIKNRKGSKDYAMFDAVPNSGEFELSTPLQSFNCNPQSFKDKTQIAFRIAEKQNVRILILDVYGKTIQEWKQEFESGDNTLLFKPLKIPAGDYTCRIEIGGGIFSLKIQHQE